MNLADAAGRPLRAMLDWFNKLARLAELTLAIEKVADGALDFQDATAQAALDFFAPIFRSRWKLYQGNPTDLRLIEAPESLRLDAMRRGMIDALALGRQEPQRVRGKRQWFKDEEGEVVAGTVPDLQDTWTNEVFWLWLEDRSIRYAREWLLADVEENSEFSSTSEGPAPDVQAAATDEDASADVPPPQNDRLEYLLDARHDLHRVQALATPRQRQILADLLEQAEAGGKPSLARAADRLRLDPGTVRGQMARLRKRAQAALGHDRVPGPRWLRRELDRIPVIPTKGPEASYELPKLRVHIHPRTTRHRMRGEE